MSMVEKIAEFLAAPHVDIAAYRCNDCGLVFDTERTACSECQGEVHPIEDTPAPVFWAQLD